MTPTKPKMHGRPLAPLKEEMVGSVHESDADHWRRHSSQRCANKCCRCNFIRHKAELQREAPWCQPRSSFMGGPWRLGCDVCQWRVSSKTKEHHTGRRRSDFRARLFAKYGFVCNADYILFNGVLSFGVEANAPERTQRRKQACWQQPSMQLWRIWEAAGSSSTREMSWSPP